LCYLTKKRKKDEKGFLLITNVRAGVIFPSSSQPETFRSHFNGFPVHEHVAQMGQQVKFACEQRKQKTK
jgi:hypothetical protein